MQNLLKNDGFENSLGSTYSNWKGWYIDRDGAVCVYQVAEPNPPTGFYQDVPADRLKGDGEYTFQVKLLSPTSGAWAAPTVWVIEKNNEEHPTQKKFRLRVGRWQIVQVNANITPKNLKKVRVELYFGPTKCELIMQRAYFGKRRYPLTLTPQGR